eukprot:3931625-Rhodomonas_salina.2
MPGVRVRGSVWCGDVPCLVTCHRLLRSTHSLGHHLVRYVPFQAGATRRRCPTSVPGIEQEVHDRTCGAYPTLRISMWSSGSPMQDVFGASPPSIETGGWVLRSGASNSHAGERKTRANVDEFRVARASRMCIIGQTSRRG